MKILIFIVLLINLVQLFCSVDKTSPLPPIKDFCLAGNEQSWVVTSKGKVFGLTNNGQEKEEIKFDQKVEQIYFLNSENGWVFDRSGQFWATTNKGKDWVKKGKLNDNRSEYYSHQLIFITNQIGWVLASSKIWLTEDGGNSWNQIYPNEEFSYNNLRGDPFYYFPIDENIGWLGMSNSRILKTTNRGKTWEDVNLEGDSTIYSLFAFDKDKCFAPAFERTGLYYTTDGGKTWQQKLSSEARKDFGIYSISFANSEIGWAVGIEFVKDPSAPPKLNGIVIKTKDGGNTWTRETNEFYQIPFRKVKFVDTQNGWLMADSAIYKTNDAGNNWIKVFEIESALK